MSTTTVSVSIQRICNRISEIHEQSYTCKEKLKILSVNALAKKGEVFRAKVRNFSLEKKAMMV